VVAVAEAHGVERTAVEAPRPGEALDQRDVQLGLTSHQYPLSRLSFDEQIQNSRCNFVPLDCVEGK
jgi:hypothetical protein